MTFWLAGKVVAIKVSLMGEAKEEALRAEWKMFSPGINTQNLIQA